MIIRSIRDNEESTFNQLFREHFCSLSFFARSIIGQELFAQDIVQECFIKVWKRHKQLTDLAGLRSYLYAAVKNDCISYLRKKTVRDKKQKIYLEKAAMDMKQSFEQSIIYAETVCELYGCIERLPEKMQEVVKLYYLEEMGTVEIGQLLRKSCDTIHHQRKAALGLLRKREFLMVA